MYIVLLFRGVHYPPEFPRVCQISDRNWTLVGERLGEILTVDNPGVRIKKIFTPYSEDEYVVIDRS